MLPAPTSTRFRSTSGEVTRLSISPDGFDSHTEHQHYDVNSFRNAALTQRPECPPVSREATGSIPVCGARPFRGGQVGRRGDR